MEELIFCKGNLETYNGASRAKQLPLNFSNNVVRQFIADKSCSISELFVLAARKYVDCLLANTGYESCIPDSSLTNAVGYTEPERLFQFDLVASMSLENPKTLYCCLFRYLGYKLSITDDFRPRLFSYLTKVLELPADYFYEEMLKKLGV